MGVRVSELQGFLAQVFKAITKLRRDWLWLLLTFVGVCVYDNSLEKCSRIPTSEKKEGLCPTFP